MDKYRSTTGVLEFWGIGAWSWWIRQSDGRLVSATGAIMSTLVALNERHVNYSTGRTAMRIYSRSADDQAWVLEQGVKFPFILKQYHPRRGFRLIHQDINRLFVQLLGLEVELEWGEAGFTLTASGRPQRPIVAISDRTMIAPMTAAKLCVREGATCVFYRKGHCGRGDEIEVRSILHVAVAEQQIENERKFVGTCDVHVIDPD